MHSQKKTQKNSPKSLLFPPGPHSQATFLACALSIAGASSSASLTGEPGTTASAAVGLTGVSAARSGMVTAGGGGGSGRRAPTGSASPPFPTPEAAGWGGAEGGREVGWEGRNGGWVCSLFGKRFPPQGPPSTSSMSLQLRGDAQFFLMIHI